MLETPRILESIAQPTASIHFLIPCERMPHVFGPAIEELLAVLKEQGVAHAPSAFAHHLKMNPGFFDFELGFTTSAPIQPMGRVQAGHWPAQRAAHTVYHGAYEGLPEAWGQFDAWMRAQGLEQADDLWELYATGPHLSPDPGAWRTELYRPLLR